MPDEKDLQKQEEEEGKNAGEKMDEDFDRGNEFKDQLIPLALEYYMEVIEEDEGCDSCGDDHHDDSDEDDHPKGGKGKKKGGNKKEEPAAGQDKQECKPQ